MIAVSQITTVILHYYRMPKLADILTEFKTFDGMILTEIECGDLHPVLTV